MAPVRSVWDIHSAIFVSLDRHCIKREWDKGKYYTYNVHSLSLVRRQKDFVDAENCASNSHVCGKAPNGETIGTSFVKTIVNLLHRRRQMMANAVWDTLVDIGPIERYHFWRQLGHITGPSPNRSWQRGPSQNAWRRWAIQVNPFIQQVCQRPNKVEERLAEERDHVQLYVDPSTESSFTKTCHNIIAKHMGRLHNEFETSSTATAKMIQHASTDCFEVDKGLDPLRNKLETHLNLCALGAIEQAAADVEAPFQHRFEDGCFSRGQ